MKSIIIKFKIKVKKGILVNREISEGKVRITN